MVRLHFLWIMTLCCASIWAQDSIRVNDTVPMRRSQMLKYDGMSVLGGIKHAYLAPMHWEKGNWLTFGGVVAGTGILWLTDEDTSDYFINQGTNGPDILLDTGYYFGKPLYNYGITGGIYVVGLLTKNEKVRKTGVLLISSATAAGIIQTILKNGVGRARPTTGLGASTFEPFSNEEAYHSFPSGHAILSFTTAYAISKQFESPWIKGGIWAVGLLTPASRLWAGAHWLSDVAVGMIISVATVESIDKYLNRERKYNSSDIYREASKKKISWNLQLTPKSIGIVGTY